MLEHSGFAIERMPGLAAALDHFIAEAQHAIAPLAPGVPGGGTVEAVRATTLFRAISDCSGLIAAIYASDQPGARVLIALDERIDDLIVASIFGESVSTDPEDDPADKAPRPRTPIETALLEEFARSLGRALEAGFAPMAPLALTFERLVTLNDAFALGRRDMPAAAARFSLPMNGGACEGLALFSQSLLMPLRKELERDHSVETPALDRRWSNLMETGVKKTRLPVTAVLEEVPMTMGSSSPICQRTDQVRPPGSAATLSIAPVVSTGSNIGLIAAGEIDAFLTFPPYAQELRARNMGQVVLSTAFDHPWSQYFCCMLNGASEFVRRSPIATERVVRAMLRATDICAAKPDWVAQRLVDRGVTPRYD